MMTENDEFVRDLRFFPVVCDISRYLTLKQIGHFNQHGYVSPIRIFDDPKDIRENRDYFDRLLANLQPGQNSYSINGYQNQYKGLYDLVMHPMLLDIAQDLLGDNVVCWGTHYFCKLPKEGKEVAWHQDAQYWPLTPSKTITMWLAIDDSDRDNGCMRVIPGSHLNQLRHRTSKAEERNVLGRTVEQGQFLAGPVDIELKAGEISVHTDMLAHGSLENRSNRRRCGLTIRYCPTSVVPQNGWNHWGSIICRGQDPERNWKHNPRPETDPFD